ncbi:hypothetical protein Tco_1353324 [Tanacetum coccineum]
MALKNAWEFGSPRHKLMLPGKTYYCWIQALINEKKIIVNEASIRCDIKLDDAEGSPCLPNATIFEDLTRIGAKTTAWNEFSSTMASAIICLANNQKFNFSMYIFDSMVRNLENVNKFWMYPRFVQVFVNQQLGDMSKHKKTFVNPSLTKKLFGNMKREGTGFSGRVTPLFDTMIVQASKEVGEDSDHLTDSNQIPIVDQPSTSSKPKKKQKVKKLEIKRKSRITKLKRLSKVGAARRVESFEDKDSLGDQEDPSKQGRNKADIDQDLNVTLIDETQGKLNDEDMFRVYDLHGEEVIVEDTTAPTIPITTAEVVTTVSAPTTTIDELTLAQTLIEIRAAKPKTITAVTTAATLVTIATTSVTTAAVTRPKAKGIVFHDQEEQVSVSKPTVSSTQPSIKDKGKAIIIESESPLKNKDQVAADEELARQLYGEMQAKIAEEERIKRQKEEEANIALIESWDNTQAMMKADFELAQKIQADKQGEITIKERSKLFVKLMNKRRKHFAKLRAEEIRKKPPTKAQKRNLMWKAQK